MGNQELAPVENPSSGDVSNWGTLPPILSEVMFRENLTVVPTDRRVNPPQGACFNCWKKGHIARDCPVPNKGPYCHNCGRDKTTVEHCPRCSESQWLYRQEGYGGLGDIEKKVLAREAQQLRETRMLKLPFPAPEPTIIVTHPEEPEVVEERPEAEAAPNYEELAHEVGFLKKCQAFSTTIAHLPRELLADLFREVLEEQRLKRRAQGGSMPHSVPNSQQ